MHKSLVNFVENRGPFLNNRGKLYYTTLTTVRLGTHYSDGTVRLGTHYRDVGIRGLNSLIYVAPSEWCFPSGPYPSQTTSGYGSSNPLQAPFKPSKGENDTVMTIMHTL